MIYRSSLSRAQANSSPLGSPLWRLHICLRCCLSLNAAVALPKTDSRAGNHEEAERKEPVNSNEAWDTGADEGGSQESRMEFRRRGRQVLVMNLLEEQKWKNRRWKEAKEPQTQETVCLYDRINGHSCSAALGPALFPLTCTDQYRWLSELSPDSPALVFNLH